VTEEQLDRLRRWSQSLSASGGERAAAGRTIATLVDRVERLRSGEYVVWEPGAVSDARRLARRLSSSDGPPARRSAARAIRMLLDESERLAAEVRPLVGLGARTNGSVNGDGPETPWDRALALTHFFEAETDEEEVDVDLDERPPPAELLERREAASRPRVASARPPGPPEEPSPDEELPDWGKYRRVVLGVGSMAVVVGLAVFGPRLAAPDMSTDGPRTDQIGAADASTLAFSVTTKDPKSVRWSVDGRPVRRGVRAAFSTSRFELRPLEDGEHTVRAEAPGPIPGSDASHEWHLTIDRTPPEIDLAPQSGVASRGKPVTVAGSVDPGVEVEVAGKPVPTDGGRFSTSMPAPTAPTISVLATDPFGNTARKRVPVNLVPRVPPAPVRAVHVTFYAWRNPELRAPILRMAAAGKIDAVELDLKDEAGDVGWDADIPYGRQIGAVKDIYDLPAAVRMLHARGVRVIGRLVCFRDPVLASAAWRARHRAQVIQTPDGQPYAGYGGFTNFANPVVRRYNIDVARAAVAAGVDEILYDYVRRPDGPRSSMVFPGLKKHEDRAIASFLRETRQALPDRVYLGASVFGVAATRPQEVAQNIPLMARELDYVAPMVYPSHWSPDEYAVADPNAQPYEIVRASITDFRNRVRGTGARTVPWLQDFSLGVPYGPDEVRAQIDAAADAGAPEFILWDPNVTYTENALADHEPEPPLPTVTTLGE